ncbi:hypothetical protein ACS8E2_05620 [Psychrobacter glaciei]|uniref:hypothetical protein n=1 Tax=Psychrobacter glaciei TaxID=619771 RepID=UPI003F48ED13
MKLTNKQEANITLGAGSNTVYLPKADAQIRAFTVHNTTNDPNELTVVVNGKTLVKKTLSANATDVISPLFNQQLKKDEPLTMTGEGVNVLLTVVEITE